MSKTTNHSLSKLDKLLALLRNARSLLIVMQDNPDPDAIAAAAALRRLALTKPQINCTLAHGGSVGRAENRALVAYLGLNLRRFQDIDPTRFDRIALVDTQPGSGNNALPDSIRPQIVIDHHPRRRTSRGIAFTDIRSRYGAASSILFEYIEAAGIEPEIPLATALLYGIRSDTQDLAREAVKPDIEAHLALYPRANLRMLAQIEHSVLPRDYFSLLHHALGHAVRQGNCICAPMGRLSNPDMMGEVADLLVRLEGIAWCLCLGVVEERILLSIRRRATDTSKHSASTVSRHTVGHDGTAGGHTLIAGGQVPLKTGDYTEISRLEKKLVRRFVKTLEQWNNESIPLVEHDRQAATN